MISKTSAVRSKSADDIISAATTHADRADKAWRELLSSLNPAESIPVGALLRQLAQLMRIQKETLIATDTRLRVEKGQDLWHRGQRDDGRSDLRGTLASTRRLVRGYYGDGAVAEMGMVGATPQQADALVVAAQGVAAALRIWTPTETLAIDLPPLDLVARANRIDAEASALADQLLHVDRESRETQGARDLKDDALETFNTEFMQIAAAVEGLFRGVGFQKLADQVRPSAHRRGRTVANVLESGGTDIDPSFDEEPVKAGPVDV